MKFKTSFFAAPLFFCEIIMQLLKKHTSPPEYCSKRALVSPYSISPNITVEKSGNRNFAFYKSITRPEF